MNNLRRTYYPIYKDFGSLIDNFLSQSETTFGDSSGKWAPAVDIKEEKDKYLVIADLPGVKKEDINISLENNVLTLQGSRAYENSESKEGYSRLERVQGSFYRQFTLPHSVDESKIGAKYKHGILEISIPKQEKSLEKRIEVQVDE